MSGDAAAAALQAVLTTLVDMGEPAAATPLVDQFDRPLRSDRPPRRPPRSDTVVTRVGDLYDWHRLSGLTPMRLAAILRQADYGDPRDQAQLAQEMEEKDLELSAVLTTRRQAVLRLPIQVLPNGREKRAEEAAALVREYLSDSLIKSLISQLSGSLVTGYALSWIHWRRMGKAVGIESVEQVPYTRLTFLPRRHGRNAVLPRYPRLLTVEAPAFGIDVPAFAAAYHTRRSQGGLPWRIGLVRPLAFLYVLKSFALKDWGSLSERFGSPSRIAYFPRYALSAQVQDLEEKLLQLAADNVVALPEEFKIESQELQNRGDRTVMQAMAEYIDHRYQHGVLGQEASTSGTPGRLGADQEQGAVRRDYIESDADDYGMTITQQVARPLVGFNLGWDVPVPHVRLVVPEVADQEQRGRVFAQARNLVSLSARQVRRELAIEEPEGLEDTIPLRPQGGEDHGME